MKHLVLCLTILTVLFTMNWQAEALLVFNPANGHYYDEIATGNINWFNAKGAAESLTLLGNQGHLATITSAEENQFIVDNLLQATSNNYWLGGFQPPGSPEPGGGWEWVNQEGLFTYTNWAPGEPNNSGGNEDGLQLFLSNGTWNDQDIALGYVVEYSNLIVIGAGTVTLVDENPPLTWNYLLTHDSGSVPLWAYTGAAITGANVDGTAAAAGWSVFLQTTTQVVFTTTTSLTSGSLTGFHITGTVGSGMGTWTAGSNSGSVEGSVPVKLSSFNATRNSNGVLIRWRTETEINNLGFNIYRVEGKKEVKINPQMIRGHGTTGSPHPYQFLDLDAPEGNVKYFIEDIDFKGNREKSKIIRVIDPKSQLTTTWGKIKSTRR